MVRCLIASLLFVMIAGCSKQLDDATALANLKADAAKVRQAVSKADNALMADMTYPRVVESVGGREVFISKMKQMSDEMKRDGFTINDAIFAEPTKPIASQSDLFALAPYSLMMTAPNGQTGTVPSRLIAISSDGGRSWKFADGTSFSRAQLKSLLPSLPDALALPPLPKAQWK